MDTIYDDVPPAGRGDQDLATGLVRLARIVQGAFARACASHGLTASQGRLLCVLTEGPRAMTGLAGILGVEKAAMTGLIDRIERRGLVQRTAVPGDRRSRHIQLTPLGQQQALAVHQDVSQNLDRLVAGLSATRCDELQRSIIDITEADQARQMG